MYIDFDVTIATSFGPTVCPPSRVSIFFQGNHSIDYIEYFVSIWTHRYLKGKYFLIQKFVRAVYDYVRKADLSKNFSGTPKRKLGVPKHSSAADVIQQQQ